MTATRASTLLERGTEVVTHRTSYYDSLFDQIAERMFPRARGFSEGPRRDPDAGGTMDLIRDTTPMRAHSRFVAVMMQGTIPRRSEWVDLEVTDDPDLTKFQPVRAWIDEVVATMRRHRYDARSNFEPAMKNMFKYEGAFGTGVAYLDTVPGKQVFQYKTLPLRECYPIVDEDGRFVGNVRRFYLTKRQLVGQWGEKALPKAVNQADAEDKFKIQHMVVRRDHFDDNLPGRMMMPFSSTYVIMDEESLIHEGGHMELPFLFGRLETDGNEAFGIGLGEVALPDIKELFAIVRTATRAAMKMTDPPMFWPDDAVVAGQINLNPGAQNIGGVDPYTGRLIAQQMPVTGDPRMGNAEAEQRRTSVEDTFWNNLFQILQQNDRMTATEVIERVRARNTLVSPAIGQQEVDTFAPLVDREYNILARRGLLPPAPPELDGVDLAPVFNSPLTKVAEAEDATSVLRGLDATAPYAELHPEIHDGVDWTEAGRTVFAGFGVPAKVLRPKREVAATQRARSADQARQAQMQQTAEMAKAAGSAAPALAVIQGGQQ